MVSVTMGDPLNYRDRQNDGVELKLPLRARIADIRVMVLFPVHRGRFVLGWPPARGVSVRPHEPDTSGTGRCPARVCRIEQPGSHDEDLATRMERRGSNNRDRATRQR